MNHIRRVIAGALAGLTLAVTLGGAAAPAAAATGLKLYVDDTPSNNGSTSCPATPYTTLAAGLSAIGSNTSNVTLTICPGTYHPTVGMNFTGFTGLKIIGLGSPIIQVPGGFAGNMIDIVSSTNVTVQGLNIVAPAGLSTTTTATAISFYQSSGKIASNTVSNWHQPMSGTPPFTTTIYHIGIVDFAPSSVKNVSITKNTVYDSQDIGIYVNEAGKPKVTSNRVVFSPSLNASFAWGGGPVKIHTGILAIYAAAGTSITGNQVESYSDVFLMDTSSRGILLYGTSGAKVTGNTVRGTAHQISIESYCDGISANAGLNTVSGNKLYDSWFEGVRILASNIGACANPHADGNKITGNKIYTSLLNSLTPYGIYIAILSGGVADGNTLKGNTLGGFDTPATAIVNNGTHTSISGNKLLAAPPAGTLAATPAAAPGPDTSGPLPAELLNLH